MKSVVAVGLVALLMSGCMGMGGAVQHEDSPAGVPPGSAPALCRDGSPPPCNERN